VTYRKPSPGIYLTPTPLLKERGYIVECVYTILLLLKEKESEDEVKNY
jgi:hypothetical protein